MNIKRKWKKLGQVNDVNTVDEVVLEPLDRNILVNLNILLVIETAPMLERVDWDTISSNNPPLIKIGYFMAGLFAL